MSVSVRMCMGVRVRVKTQVKAFTGMTEIGGVHSHVLCQKFGTPAPDIRPIAHIKYIRSSLLLDEILWSE